MSEVWVRAQLVKVWPTGECDVKLEYPGAWLKSVAFTLPGRDVVSVADDHVSRCAVRNTGRLAPGPCDCGALEEAEEDGAGSSFGASGEGEKQEPTPEASTEPTAPATGLYFCEGCLREFLRLIDEPLPDRCPDCGGLVMRTVCDTCTEAGECQRVGLHAGCADYEAPDRLAEPATVEG